MTTAEGRIRILSYPDLEPVMRLSYDSEREFALTGHTSSCLTAELQPTGRYLATGGSDSIIALWDTQEWICQRTITTMVGAVRSISTHRATRLPLFPLTTTPLLTHIAGWTFDGSYIVGGSDEGTGLDVTHAETGDKIHTFKTAGACPVVAWAPTRYWLAYSDAGALRIVGVDVDKK